MWRCVALWVLGAALAGSACAADDEATDVVIDLSVGDDGLLDWRVAVPPGVQRLDFAIGSPRVRQALRSLPLTSADGCSQFDDTGVALRDAATCRQLHWRVQPKLLARQALYEAALPQSRGGVLLHTGYYALVARGHGLRWRFTPPQGGTVLFEGRLSPQQVTWRLAADGVAAALVEAAGDRPGAQQARGLRALLAQQYVLLSRSPSVPLPGGTLVHDAQASPALVALVQSALEADLQAYGRAYRLMPAGPVGVVLTVADQRGFQGDVTDGRMMGLRFDARAPLPAGAALLQMRRFIAHEVAHWWNMGICTSDPNRPWLHEGHADWAALLALHASGQIDAAGLRDEIEGGFNRCLLARGSRPAASLPAGYGGSDDVYACGMSLMAVAQAGVAARAGQGANVPGDPLALLATLHQQGGGVWSADAFAAWADGAAGGASGAVATLLSDTQLPFDAGFRQLAQQRGLADARAIEAPGAVLSPALRSALAGRIGRHLMGSDCGRFSFWTEPDGLQLDTQVTCTSLRPGGAITSLQGLPLLAQPAQAWAAAAQACAQGQPVAIGYRTGGDTAFPCTQPWPALPLTHVLVLRPQALQVLGIGPDAGARDGT